MIVKRTEKAMPDITKHEIVAKLIMEVKEIKNISRMSCIEPLSESVKVICPELEPAVSKLMNHLETFLNVLESTDEDRKELIHVRINDAINEFLKEATRILPQPHLLKVVDSWKPRKKVVYNAMIFENVLKCLCYDDPITRAEAKLIAGSLKEDKVFGKILLNAEAEPETEADSEQFSISIHSSQANDNIYSQEFAKNSQACKTDKIPSYLQPPNNYDPDSLHLDTCPPVPDNYSNMPNNSKFQSNMEPPHLSPAHSLSESPPMYPFMHRPDPSQVKKQNICGLGGLRDSLSELRDAPSRLRVSPNGFRDSPCAPRDSVSQLRHSPSGLENAPINNEIDDLRNEANNHMQFAQSSENESHSDDFNSVLHEKIKFKQMYENQKRNKAPGDSDTSDCEKNAEFRFLTPTYFKKGTKKKLDKVVYLSDSDSNGSSVITTAANSQKNDPNWSTRLSICALEMTKKNRNVPVKKKSAQQLDSDSSSSSEDQNVANFQSSIFLASRTSSNSTNGRPSKKRRVTKLYRTPDRSMHDFVTQVRRPTPAASNGVPGHSKDTNREATKKHTKQSEKTTNKRQKCKQCSKSFKTVIALRRHVFLQHTQPPEDSDCDS